MLKRLLPIGLAACALALPAGASATAAPAVTVSGRAVALQGRLLFRAELGASAGAQPVRVVARIGAVRFVDLSGDLQVACRGKGEEKRATNSQGQSVVTCAGMGGGAEATGSHFRVLGFALQFRLAIPDGYTGTVQGHLKPWQPGQGQGQGQGRSRSRGTGPGGGSSTGAPSASIAAALAAAARN